MVALKASSIEAKYPETNTLNPRTKKELENKRKAETEYVNKGDEESFINI